VNVARFRIVRHAAQSARAASGVIIAGAVLCLPGTAHAQVPIKRTASGFNLFTVTQDVDVGRAAANELVTVLRPVRLPRVQTFLDRVTTALGAQVRTTTYAFTTTAVSSPEANVFPLPGGPVFISREILAVTKHEGEVAGLIAHAMAHVILRHGTERASRAYLEQAGIGALGGWGGESRTAARMINTSGGFGLHGAFLTFAQAEEYEADALGSELMAKAGYDPVAMAAVFATLRREKRRDQRLDAFFNRHPAAGDRESRIRNLANVLGHGAREVVGGFAAARLKTGVRAPTATATTNVSAGVVEQAPTPITLKVPSPSSRFVKFAHPDSLLTIEHPENWEVYPSGLATSFAPAGGVVEHSNGEPRLLNGMVLNYYAPFEGPVDRWNNSLTRNFAPFEDRTRPRGTLEDATDDLVRQIIAINPYLSAPVNSARNESFEGSRGYSVRLRGPSPITGQVERVTIYTRVLPDDHVVYLACVTPAKYAVAMERACGRMAKTLRLNDAAAHRN
jgi:hypothetical protein